jgi:hypothetical protein
MAKPIDVPQRGLDALGAQRPSPGARPYLSSEEAVMGIENRNRVAPLVPRLFALLVLALAGISVFLLGHAYLTSPGAFNSDDLLCSDLCDDLLHGRDMTGWHLPGAPYVFPDVVLLAPCHLLAPNIAVEFLAYGLLIHLGLLVGVTWLGRLTGLDWRQALTAAGCGSILLAVTHLNKESGDRAFLLIHPGSHTGALLVGIFLLPLAVRSLRHGPSWSQTTAFLLAGGLGRFSDKLLAVQFLAPMALALIALTACRALTLKRAAEQLALLAASFLASFVIQALFWRAGFQLLSLEQLGSHYLTPGPRFLATVLGDLEQMVGQLYRSIEREHLLCALIPLHLLAALLALRSGFQTLRGERTPPAQGGLDRHAVRLVALTLLLSPPCILGALLALGMASHEAIYRYTLSCWFLPCLFLPLMLSWFPGRVARTAGALVQLAVVMFALQRAIALVPRIDRRDFEQPYPPLAQVLDRLAQERGPLRGLGGFWLARSTTWFTRADVVVNPVGEAAAPLFHASNPNRFLPADPEDLQIPSHQFLLLRRGGPICPSPGIATLYFGEPAEKIAVGTDEIWLYDSVRTPLLDRFLHTRIAERLRAHRPYTGPCVPASLAQPKANFTPADAPGNVTIEAGQALEVRFARPLTGRTLDIGADFADRFELEFRLGAERLGRLTVPRVLWTGSSYRVSGIQSRLLPLSPSLRDRPWDSLLVHARADASDIRLGHVLVFADDVPGLTEEKPIVLPSRVRLEGEDLLPSSRSSLRLDETDAQASGGRTRRPPDAFRNLFACTPCLALPSGRYRLECAMKVGANNIAEEVAHVSVGCLAPPARLVERSLRGVDFPVAGRYVTQTVAFEIVEGMENVLFGVTTSGRTSIALDYIDLIPEPPPSSPGGR